MICWQTFASACGALLRHRSGSQPEICPWSGRVCSTKARELLDVQAGNVAAALAVELIFAVCFAGGMSVSNPSPQRLDEH
jgi:hypothetical protein